MPIALRLKSMTKADKLRVMEQLWADLSRDAAGFESPAWHLRELEKTEARIASGEEEFIDWEVAKKSLRRRAK